MLGNIDYNINSFTESVIFIKKNRNGNKETFTGLVINFHKTITIYSTTIFFLICSSFKDAKIYAKVSLGNVLETL